MKHVSSLIGCPSMPPAVGVGPVDRELGAIGGVGADHDRAALLVEEADVHGRELLVRRPGLAVDVLHVVRHGPTAETARRCPRGGTHHEDEHPQECGCDHEPLQFPHHVSPPHVACQAVVRGTARPRARRGRCRPPRAACDAVVDECAREPRHPPARRAPMTRPCLEHGPGCPAVGAPVTARTRGPRAWPRPPVPPLRPRCGRGGARRTRR